MIIGTSLRVALASGYSAGDGISHRFRGSICMRLADRLGLSHTISNTLGYGIVYRMTVRYTLALIL